MEGSGAPAGVEGGTPENTGGELDTSLYPGIENVPQDQRQYLDPILKEINTNANKRISEVNGKLNTWKPYEELGVHETLTPEEMQNVLGLLEVIGEAEQGNVDGFKDWWSNVGNQFELFENEPNGNDELEEEGDDFMSPEDLKQLVSEQLQEAIGPIAERLSAQDEEKLLGEADSHIDSQLAELKKEHGDFGEDVEAKICGLALRHDGPDAIKKGFEDYVDIVKGAEGKLFSEVERQPSTPESPGTPDTNPKQIKSFKDAEAAVVNRMEASSNS
jgi:hypothetical protein